MPLFLALGVIISIIAITACAGLYAQRRYQKKLAKEWWADVRALRK